MDIKSCDRCGTQFRVLVKGSEEKPPQLARLGQSPEAAVQDATPKEPQGLRALNELALPFGGKHGTGKDVKAFHSIAKIDVCADCVRELLPTVAEWFAKKK
jgi:hypothetical protein